MKLRHFKASNLFALGKVELDLENRGLLLVTGYSEDEQGANGAGKSSLANKGILWTLFGETAGGLRADAVRNRHNKKKCKGEIIFNGLDGQRYKIVRERPAKLSLFSALKDISATKAVDTQLLINSLLGIDFKTFIQTSYFGQGRKLSYAALPPKDQKSVLEQILPMEEVDRWAKYADVKVKEVTKLCTAAERKQFEAAAVVSAQQGNLLDLGISSSRWEEVKQAGIQDAKYSLEHHKTARFGSVAQLETLEKQIELTDLGKVDQEIKEVVASLNKYGEDRTTEINYGKAVDSHGQWSSRYHCLSKDLADLEKATSCPTCLRDFDDQTVLGVKKRILQQKTLMIEAKSNCELANEAKGIYEQALELIRREVRVLQSAHQTLNGEKHTIAKKIAQAESLRTDLQSERTDLEKNLERVENDMNPYTKSIEDSEKKVAKLVKAEVAAGKVVNKIKRELDHLVYWRDVYAKELKLKLFEDACPFLDTRTAYHLNKLKNRQLHAKFTTIKRLSTGAVKEEFNVEVGSVTGGLGFDSLSGGEQQMVSFAIGLALSDLSSRTSSGRSSFTVLDEPFSELDARNSEAIVEYLVEEMCKDKETVFLISNEESLKGLVSNRIHVIKKQGVSNVEC